MTVVVFVVMDTANVADRICEVEKSMVDRVLRISRRMFSLSTGVLSPSNSSSLVLVT
jgi:hypothetical protein